MGAVEVFSQEKSRCRRREIPEEDRGHHFDGSNAIRALTVSAPSAWQAGVHLDIGYEHLAGQIGARLYAQDARMRPDLAQCSRHAQPDRDDLLISRG